MKKILLFTLLLANFFFANANTRMSAYRWRNDDGTETSATWKASINTPIQINNLDPIRIRIAVEEFSTRTGTISVETKLQFSVDGANWKYITDVDSPFSFINTSNVSHESNTTQQIMTRNATSFVVGQFSSAASNKSITLDGNASKFTELEFSIKPNALISESVTYRFRVKTTDTNTVTPTLTYSCGTAKPIASSPQNFNSNAKVSDLAATGTDLKWYTSATGGTALGSAVPLSKGLYYVSQTISCESPRTQVQVNINGAALNFAGGYVDLPISMPASYTKEAWINLSDLSEVNNIISGGDQDGKHAIYVPNGNLSAGHNGTYQALRDNDPLDVDTWYHVAVTYDASTTTMTLYKNGDVVATDNTILPFTGNSVRIGAFDTNKNLLYGVIDEARIWEKVLTQDEIKQNMNCEFSGPQPGLIGYYKFNQGFEGADNSIVTTLTDSSGNGNDGTLVNFDLSASSSNWISSSVIQTGQTCVTLSVGDHDLDLSSSLKVYPNPASSAFFIDSESNGTIVIFDILGKIVQTQKLNSGTTTLDLGSTPNGVYLLKVTNEKNQSKTVKLIKN